MFPNFVASLGTPFVNAKESIAMRYAKISGAASGLMQGGVTKGAGRNVNSDLNVDPITGVVTQGSGVTKYRNAESSSSDVGRK